MSFYSYCRVTHKGPTSLNGMTPQFCADAGNARLLGSAKQLTSNSQRNDVVGKAQTPGNAPAFLGWMQLTVPSSECNSDTTLRRSRYVMLTHS